MDLTSKIARLKPKELSTENMAQEMEKTKILTLAPHHHQ